MPLVPNFSFGVYDNAEEARQNGGDSVTHIHAFHPVFGTRDYYIVADSFFEKLRYAIRDEWINGFTIIIQDVRF